MSVVVDGVLGPLPLVRHTRGCPCFSIVPEAMHEASRKPLKGAMSAQIALQGFEMETSELLGGTKEKSMKSISSTRGHWIALQANQYFV